MNLQPGAAPLQGERFAHSTQLFFRSIQLLGLLVLAGTEQNSVHGCQVVELVVGLELLLPAPVVQRQLGSVGEFPFFIASRLNFPVPPAKFPWIRVKSGFGSVLASTWERDGPGSGPSKGDGGSMASAPSPSRHASRGHGPHQLHGAEHGCSACPFLQRREFF